MLCLREERERAVSVDVRVLCVGTRNPNLIDYVHKDFGFHEGKRFT